MPGSLSTSSEPFAAGAAVEKVNALPRHVVRNGTRGVVTEVLGSDQRGIYGYFVRFPEYEHPVFVAGPHLKAVEPEKSAV
jgi:hypothetical protein